MVATAVPPAYWAEAQAALGQDPLLRRLIDAHPGESLCSYRAPFYTLMRAITGQQISVAAAAALWERLEAALPAMTPACVAAASEATLRQCGLSQQKRRYIRALADFFEREAINGVQRWDGWTDHEVRACITRVPGIAQWTADMFLIFCLMRPDVLPLGDVGLQRALLHHYMPEAPRRPFPREEAARVAERWRPYRTVATWYLWRGIDPSTVQY